MKVLFPQPESAARPITTVPDSPDAHVITLLLPLLLHLLLVLYNTTCFWVKPKWVFVGVEIEHVEMRDWVVYTVQIAILEGWGLLNCVLAEIFSASLKC